VSRLLFLLPAIPEPLDAGAKIRNQGLLKLLGADHEVDAIAFGEPGSDALTHLTGRSVVVPRPKRRSALTRAGDVARTKLPDIALRLWAPAFVDAVRCCVSNGGYDAVQAEGIEMARYLSVVAPDRRIYDAHNAEFLLQRRFSETASSSVARLYSRLQWRRLERFERAVVRASRLTLAVSNHEANQLRALAGEGAQVHVVPNGIDASAYPFREPDPTTRSVLFLGKLDFRANTEALRWFVNDVLPGLPTTRLFAVGGAPPAWLIDAGQHDDRIAVTGYVDDERPYLARCAALVLPFKTGGGSRLKALIAMASGLPIVSTRLGMEGLDAEPGQHFLVANSATEWVPCLDRLLGDAHLRQRLARNGRALVEQRYDWSAIRADVRAAYGSVLAT
jgi:glycosyltransferase involved in cell wall biosynthesis